MTITNHCTCMVDSCWRRGICEFCINNHGGNRATVSCSLTPDAYAARKKRWDQNHDEPHYPTNTALGILSKETLDVSKDAILALRDVQIAVRQCNLETMQLKNSEGLDEEKFDDLLLRLEQAYTDLTLLVEKAEAAMLMSQAAKTLVPRSFS